MKAAKKAAMGSNMEQIVQAAKDVMAKVHVYFAMDTLEYLRRGGRVSLPRAALASLLKVKPIMVFNNGKLEPAAKPRTMPKAIESLLDFMKEKVTDTPLHVAVMHADNQDGAENLKKEITSLLGDHLSLMLEDPDDFREVIRPSSEKEEERLAELWEIAVREVAKELKLTKYLA